MYAENEGKRAARRTNPSWRCFAKKKITIGHPRFCGHFCIGGINNGNLLTSNPGTRLKGCVFLRTQLVFASKEEPFNPKKSVF